MKFRPPGFKGRYPAGKTIPKGCYCSRKMIHGGQDANPGRGDIAPVMPPLPGLRTTNQSVLLEKFQPVGLHRVARLRWHSNPNGMSLF
jgi:hypothetical protein